jgi:hypothetical protein
MISRSTHSFRIHKSPLIQHGRYSIYAGRYFQCPPTWQSVSELQVRRFNPISCEYFSPDRIFDIGVARWSILLSLSLMATLSDTPFSFYRSAMVSAQCADHAVEPIAQMTASTPMVKIERVPKCWRIPSRSSKLVYTS